jgi:6-phosphogluconolactonase
MKRWLWVLGIGSLALSGCGKFFVPQGSTTPSNTVAGDVLYIANLTAANLIAYGVSKTGALTAVSGSPYTLGGAPTSMAITPGNTYLYVGSADGITGYSIGTGGVLTELNSGTAIVTDVVASPSMQVDTSGNYLMVAGTNLSTAAPEIGIYQIDTTTGLLTELTGSPLAVADGSGATGSGPGQLYITPNNQFVYLTLGTGGTEVLTFTESSGALTDTGKFQGLRTGGTAQVGVVANSASSLLFIAETGLGVRVFTLGSSGQTTEITGSPFAAGTGPGSMVLNTAGTDLYVANKGSGTISGFSVASTGVAGTLKALSGSPFNAGTLPLSLTLDQSGDFLAAANSGGTPNLGVYSIGATTAALTSVSNETSTTATGAFLVISTLPTN